MRLRECFAAAGVVCGFFGSAYAGCPVYPNTTLVIRAEVGDLQVDTTGQQPVADIRTQGGSVRENCSAKRAEYSGSAWGIWRIQVPRDIDLDLIAVGGSITVGDVDGDVFLRTSGGPVTAGNIRGDAAIATLGGAIKVGNIGGRAELRSPGTIEAGNIGGSAGLHTTAGRIVVGNITGERIEVEAGRTITVSSARGVKAFTTSGDIVIGEAASVDAKTSAGNILTKRVRGPFQAHTERGQITIESAGAWVEASTNQGDIEVHLVPADVNGDLHMNLEAGEGNVTAFLPQRIRASAEMVVEHPIFRAAQIFSDFPMLPLRSFQGLAIHAQSLINGGGNRILLRTSQGRIHLRKN